MSVSTTGGGQPGFDWDDLEYVTRPGETNIAIFNRYINDTGSNDVVSLDAEEVFPEMAFADDFPLALVYRVKWHVELEAGSLDFGVFRLQINDYAADDPPAGSFQMDPPVEARYLEQYVDSLHFQSFEPLEAWEKERNWAEDPSPVRIKADSNDNVGFQFGYGGTADGTGDFFLRIRWRLYYHVVTEESFRRATSA